MCKADPTAITTSMPFDTRGRTILGARGAMISCKQQQNVFDSARKVRRPGVPAFVRSLSRPRLSTSTQCPRSGSSFVAIQQAYTPSGDSFVCSLPQGMSARASGARRQYHPHRRPLEYTETPITIRIGNRHNAGRYREIQATGSQDAGRLGMLMAESRCRHGTDR